MTISLFAFALGGEVVGLVSETGLVAKIVLLILLAFSLLSWSIIVAKIGLFRRATVQSGTLRARLPPRQAPAGYSPPWPTNSSPRLW